MSGEIAIRSPNNPAEFRALQDVQRRSWGIVEDSYLLPLSTMISVHHHGGSVLGAFSETGDAVGLSFGFLGRIDGRLCLYSQLTGIVPELQGTGLGTRLKLAQQDFCRSEKIGVIAWAFDPLQAGNAHFNLQKLGATSKHFHADMYGPRTDALNAGVPTDRIIAEWEIDAGPRTEIEADCWLLEIPEDISALRRDDPVEAENRRIAVGQALKKAFEDGFRAVGFVRRVDEKTARNRCFYAMKRDGPRSD